MKNMNCSICDEPHVVDDKVEKVTCGDCLLAGEGPTRKEDGVWYYRPEAFAKIQGPKTGVSGTWEYAQSLRGDGWSIRRIAKQLQSSKSVIHRHTVPPDGL